jgi:hypothetical protein
MPKVDRPGVYRARAVTGEPGTTKNGTDYISVMFEITEGPERGKHAYWDGYMSDKAYLRTVQTLRSCGWDGEDIVALEGLGAREVEIDVRDEEYNGKVYTKVAFVNDPTRGGGGRVKLEGGARRDFAERLRAKVMIANEKLDAAGIGVPADDLDDLPPELR